MKRKTPSFASTNAGKASAQQQASELATLSSYDLSSDFFASISQVVEGYRLRVFDTHTSSSLSEIQLPRDVTVSCLNWGSLEGESSDVKSPGKKKKNKNTAEKVVSLGLSNGDISLTLVKQGTILKTLKGGHTTTVSDVCFFNDGSHMLSSDLDGFVVRWNVITGEQIHKFRADTKPIHKLQISHNQTHLLTAGHQIMLWEIATSKLIQTYTGHASPITQILFTPDDSHCLSIAEQDRSVCVWNTKAEGPRTATNTSVFSVESQPTQLSVSVQGHVIVVADDGVCYLWQSLDNPDQPISTKKKAKFTSKPADGKLKVISTTSDAAVMEEIGDSAAAFNARIPIISAIFCKGKVNFARGSWTRPIFESVNYLDNSGFIVEDISLSRAPASSFVNQNEAKAPKSAAPSQSTVIGQTDFALNQSAKLSKEEKNAIKSLNADPTLEDRIKSMQLETDDNKGDENTSNRLPNSRRFRAPTASSLSQLLSQAIQAGDNQMLEQALNTSDLTVIYGSVRRIPISAVVPLLDALLIRLQRNPARARLIVDWIRAVVTVHSAYLVSASKSSSNSVGGIGELPKQLGALYQTIDARIGAYQKLMKLAGRLDLVVEQIHARAAANVAVDEDDEVAVYNEDGENKGEDGSSDESEEEDEEDVSEDESESNEEMEEDSGEEGLGEEMEDMEDEEEEDEDEDEEDDDE